RVGIGQEVLPQGAAGSQIMGGQEAPHVGRREQPHATETYFGDPLSDHHSMRTCNTPWPGDSAIARNTLRSRSMMRPPTNGPRAATVQLVDAPVFRLMTLTTVPLGSFR